MVKALSMGADDYVIKPFSSTELLARVASSLRKRRAADNIESHQPIRLGDDAKGPRYIFTEPRVGYRMAKT